MERAIDHIAVMVINCSAIGAMAFLIFNGHPWWSLIFLFCFSRSSPRECSPQKQS